MYFLHRCTDDFNGAQCKAVCVEAGMIALRREATVVTHEDFMDGILEVQAKKKQNLNYYAWSKSSVFIIFVLEYFCSHENLSYNKLKNKFTVVIREISVTIWVRVLIILGYEYFLRSKLCTFKWRFQLKILLNYGRKTRSDRITRPHAKIIRFREPYIQKIWLFGNILGLEETSQTVHRLYRVLSVKCQILSH